MTLDAPIAVAIITASATILVSALTLLVTKAKEREAAWNTQKLEHYKAFMLALNATVGGPPSVREAEAFANAANNIFLVGSARVLVCLRPYIDITAFSSGEIDVERHDELLTNLLIAMRADIAPSGKTLPADYRFRLWAGRPRP